MRLNKYQQNMMRHEKRTAAMSGKGLFIFRNNTSGDLMLPRPTKSGVNRIGKDQEFQGDDYYMYMVRNNELRLVRQLESSNPLPINENTEVSMSDKLITEQPPTVTNEGTVEYVQRPHQQKLNEAKPAVMGDAPTDVLLNENPLDGIEII